MKAKWIKLSAVWMLVFCMTASMFQSVMTVQAEESGVSDSTDWDAAEMNKTMPTAGNGALAYAEFDSASGNGWQASGDWQAGYDISSETTVVKNPLVLSDVTSLGNSFSIVFRAKLKLDGVRDRAILSFSSDDLSTNDWKNALAVGVCGGNLEDVNDNKEATNNDTYKRYMYYEIRQDQGKTDSEGNAVGTGLVPGGNAYVVSPRANTTGDDDWHTIALVQTGSGFNYYVDGELVEFVETATLTSDGTTSGTETTIGALYKSEEQIYARVGRFYYSNGGFIFGKFDWFAFYGSALSATEVAALSDSQDTIEVAYYSDISPYRTSTGYTAPMRRGHIFSGWYQDYSCTIPIGTSVDSGAAYAKFVPEDVLSTKAQISNSYTASGNTYRSIRFITSVDSLDYSRIGFKLEIDGKTYDCASDKVYSKLYAIGASSGVVMKFTPQSTFSDVSTHFKTWTYTYIPESDFGTKINALPYWITQDGTYVTGDGDVKSINLGITAAKMKSSSELTVSSVSELWNVEIADAWDSTSSSNTYSAQGGYTDGTYYYQAFIECVGGSKDNTNVCIAQYDMEGNLKQKVTGLKYDHANDITYNSTENKFLVSYAYPNYTKITCFTLEDTDLNAETLEIQIGETITLDYNIISIAYNEAKDQYVVGLKYTQDFRILDADFNALTAPITANSGSGTSTTQGVGCDETFIYFVLYNPNVIMVYDWDGNFVTKIDLENVIASSQKMLGQSYMKYEPENISIIEHEIYIGCNYNDAIEALGGIDSFTVYKFTLDNITK